jgi:hypothetical protein
MSTFRTIIVSVLIFIMLPWGAFARTFGYVDGRTDTAHAMGQQTSDPATQVQDATDPHHGALWTATKRCRAPGIPGSPCGPDMPLPTEVVLIADCGISRAAYSSTAPRMPGRQPTGIAEPPRSC